MIFSEVVDSLQSAEEFTKLNKIKPKMIVVIWSEKVDGDKDGE